VQLFLAVVMMMSSKVLLAAQRFNAPVAAINFSTSFAERKFFIITFTGSILWIAVYSYLMVWWATVAGETMSIPPPVSARAQQLTL
jgi:hypothetical protein